MSQVLARKWRPKNFHELVGQEHVTQTLTYALNHQEIHHAYLFTGTRGVGKTTIARIFAKSLNCRTNGISAEPCGQCAHCLEIDAGRFPDLIEVDAASKNSADDTRQLLQNVAYAPIKGCFKVYLIDEVHMFSTESFNALLKTLEEPPEHVKFILATTEVQKLPATVLSRCIQFQLKNMTPAQIRGQLEKILTTEGRAFDIEALEHIAEAADGSMRDSLSLLDQAIAFGQGSVRTENVSQLLGTVPSEIIRKIFTALADSNPIQIRETLAQLHESAPDYTNLMRRILEALQQITIVQLQAQRRPDEISPELAAIAGRLPVELVQLWYQIATDSWQILPYQPNLAAACEMTLLRMLALQPIFPHQALESVPAVPTAYPAPDAQPALADIAEDIQYHPHDEAALRSSVPLDESPAPPAAAVLDAVPDESPAPYSEASEAVPESASAPSIPVAESRPILPETAVPIPTSANALHPDAAEQLVLTVNSPKHWHELVWRLSFSSRNIQHVLAENLIPSSFDGSKLTLSGDANSNLHLWQTADWQQEIEQALSAYLGIAVQIAFAASETQNTHAKFQEDAEKAEQNRAKAAFYADSAVQRLQQEFGAQVQEHSIHSLKSKE